MFLCSWYNLLLYYTTYIIINIKNFINIKTNKTKTKTHIKYNNSLKSVVVRRLNEQHLIQSLAANTKETILFWLASHGGWREMPLNLTFWVVS